MDEQALSQFISNVKDISPNLATRTYNFTKLIKSTEALKKAIFNNRKKLKWNLTRIYRIRNEIVHNAAIGADLETLTGHLRYYFRFALSRYIQFFSSDPYDINLDNAVNSRDFFENERLLFDSQIEAVTEKTNISDFINRLLEFELPETTLRT